MLRNDEVSKREGLRRLLRAILVIGENGSQASRPRHSQSPALLTARQRTLQDRLQSLRTPPIPSRLGNNHIVAIFRRPKSRSQFHWPAASNVESPNEHLGMAIKRCVAGQFAASLTRDALYLRACIAPTAVLYPEASPVAVVSIHAVDRHRGDSRYERTRPTAAAISGSSIAHLQSHPTLHLRPRRRLL